ncbi:MAG: tail fiber domain-containing protein [Verrucomicrobia bacterium]|nr:tail fiber domain-containing protein [Verrucomicrobiota bacterium]
MKLRHLPTLCAALLALCPILASAQTSAVPGFISYQGRVVDASGANVGAGTPVNRTVIFRIWDNPSSTNAANLIYSEAQTVTVSEGEFSVLVGQGVANTTQTYGYAETTKKLADIGLAFGGSTRFLGVTVAAASTIATTDNEITPRQQIVSTAFAMRAKYAEQVGSNGIAALTALDSGRVGIGTLAPPALFTVSGANLTTTTTTPQLLVTADDITERLRIGVDSTGTGTGFLQAFKEGTGAQNLLLNPNGGNVGIGNTNPAVALSVTGAITATGAITGGSISTSGAITATGAITTTGAITATGAITGGSFTSAAGSLTTNTGNIGIGTTAPTTRFQLDDGTNTGPYASALISRPTNSHTGSHMAFMRTGAQVMGVGYAPSVNTFGFGQGVSGVAFSPGYLAIDQNNGNVGIATASPTSKLDVNGNANVRGQINLTGIIAMENAQWIYGDGEPAFLPRSSDGTYLNYGTNGLFIRNNNSSTMMTMTHAGTTSIGTTTVSARLNVGTKTASYTRVGVLYTDGASGNNNDEVNVPLSIWADGYIAASIFHVVSDSRIKTILHPTDSAKDLQTLMAIQVTDYQFKDTVINGKRPQKKLIAQQVEEFYPEAVNTTKGVVPDIYKNAAIKEGWVMLATDLKVGDRVRLISASGETMEEVLEVRGDAFRTSLKSAEEKTFVYGREVSDFRSVDYDAIAMLNVSATQQIKHEKDAEIQALRDENAALRREIAAKEKSMEARLIALERRMSGEGTAKTVSLKTVSLKTVKDAE